MRLLLVLAMATMLTCGVMGCHHSGGGCATCGQGGATVLQNGPVTGEPPLKASN